MRHALGAPGERAAPETKRGGPLTPFPLSRDDRLTCDGARCVGAFDGVCGRLLLVDALGMKFRELKLRKNPDCPVCGTHPTVTKLIDYNEFCGIRGEEKSVGGGVPEIQVEELKRRLDNNTRSATSADT